MIDSKDLFKASALVAATAAVAAVGFAAGYVVARDPQSLRRWARAAAAGLERVQVALAETREELGDLWADARAQARQDVEDASFDAAAEPVLETGAAVPAEHAARPARSGRAQRKAPVRSAAPSRPAAH
jgi:hypothetical protein